MCYNVRTMVFSYLYYLLDFPLPLMLINACKVQECVLYEVFFCWFIISHCLFWQNFISTPHIDSSTKPVSPAQPSGVPGLFQRPLSSLQEHRLAAAPAGSYRSVPNSWGWQRLPPDLPLLPSLGIPTCLPPSPWYGKIVSALVIKKVRMDYTELKAGGIKEFAQGLHPITGRPRLGFCPDSQPYPNPCTPQPLSNAAHTKQIGSDLLLFRSVFKLHLFQLSGINCDCLSFN